MKMDNNGETLRVDSVQYLGEANANAFRDWVRGAFSKEQRNIEVDLSQTSFVDSCGLGALVALHKCAATRKGKLSLVNPPAAIQQLLELTRLDGIFEITRR